LERGDWICVFAEERAQSSAVGDKRREFFDDFFVETGRIEEEDRAISREFVGRRGRQVDGRLRAISRLVLARVRNDVEFKRGAPDASKVVRRERLR
jgi:hypothetical protein